VTDLLEARYEKDPSIVYREIAGEAVLVPIRRNVADMAKIYSLDPVGADIWKLIDGQRTLGDVRDALLAEYDVAPDVLDADLGDFVQKLVSIGVLKVC
jgi:hypothetical protein